MNTESYNTRIRSGFTLVELSIVLVILGLLTGGILAGQSLIRAAELRAISNELGRYATATMTFRDKYFALPGDMDNATRFWGKDTTNCNGDPGLAGSPGACNGDGNGRIFELLETYQVWRHLAVAGLIEGSYSGNIVGGVTNVPGVNAPASKFSRGTYGFSYTDYRPGDAMNTEMNYGNNFSFGASNVAFGATGPILKPEEQWNIDTKMDDGRPGQGKLISFYWDTCTTATGFTDYNGEYDLQVTSPFCAFRYKLLD